MALTKDERQRVNDLVALIYADGYADGLARVVAEYGFADVVGRASERMEGALDVRLDLVGKAMDGMMDRLGRKALELRGQGMKDAELVHELTSFARDLATNKAEIISQMEFAQARFDGAGHLMDESGLAYEYTFPHFDLGRPGHERCEICEGIEDDGPYTPEEAEAKGFPSLPHPDCDCGFVITLVGEKAKYQQFPV